MKIYIIPNITKLHHIDTIKTVVESLSRFTDVECLLDKDICQTVFANDKYCKYGIDEADLIVSFGGDGTLLRASKVALEKDLPIVGINAGRLGYLCKYKLNDIVEAKTNPFIDLHISNRDVLAINYNDKEYLALNDFIFASKNTGYTVELKVNVKDKEILYHSSGLIVCTATGSSAYNATAGGSLIDVDLKANVLTPICPCDYERRSLAFANSEKIIIQNHRTADPIDICCDGEIIGSLDKPITINKYQKSLKLVY